MWLPASSDRATIKPALSQRSPRARLVSALLERVRPVAVEFRIELLLGAVEGEQRKCELEVLSGEAFSAAEGAGDHAGAEDDVDDL